MPHHCVMSLNVESLVESPLAAPRPLRLIDDLASAVVRYQLQFKLDVNNLALVLYLQLLKKYWASVVGLTYFKYPNNAKPCSLADIC